MKAEHIKELRQAYDILEHPGFRIKAMNAIGKPIEKGIELLPDSLEHQIAKACNVALGKAADFALFTLQDAGDEKPSNWFHRMSVWATGALGGFGGLPGTLVELPVSTTIMLRSIFDIAKGEGENIYDPATKLAALEVFALGGNNKNDDLADTAYYSVRMAMAMEVQTAYRFLTQSSGKLIDKNAPALIQLIQKIAARFCIPVTEKAVAQAIPVISAGIGAMLNDIFIAHFQDMAHGHFTVRRLERKYGKDIVERTYNSFHKPK